MFDYSCNVTYVQTHLPSSFCAQIKLRNDKMTSSGYCPTSSWEKDTILWD